MSTDTIAMREIGKFRSVKRIGELDDHRTGEVGFFKLRCHASFVQHRVTLGAARGTRSPSVGKNNAGYPSIANDVSQSFRIRRIKWLPGFF